MSGEVSLEKIAGPDDAPKLHAIFVHGLGGDARGTWTFDDTSLPGKAKGWLAQKLSELFAPKAEQNSKQGPFWPEWLAQDIDGLAVYALNYPSNPLRWRAGWSVTKSSVAILDALMDDPRLRRDSAPIVFVCHSLGGLVVKKLIVTANIDRGQQPEKGDFLDRISGVAFLATPHQGAFLASFLTELGWAAASESLRDLQANGDFLLDVQSSYRNMIEDDGRRIAHCVYYEDQTVIGVKIVNAGSADPGLTGVRPVAVLRDHFGVCKMQEKDQVYNGVLALMKKALTDRPPSTRRIAEATNNDTKAIRERVEQLTSELSLTYEQKEEIAAELEKVKAEHNGTIELVAGFLETMVGRKVPLTEYTSTLFRIVADWKTAGEKIDALKFSANLQPGLGALREEARAAHREGRLDEAELLLARIAREEIEALERLIKNRREIDQEIVIRRKYAAGTKMAQASVAHARLDYLAAAALYGEAADYARDNDDQTLYDATFAQAVALRSQGDEFGDNASLHEAIRLYRYCIKLAPRERVPLDWAATQNNLGVALHTLGERESGTARLEEAVTAYRAALEERTREHVPRYWASTQVNLGNVFVSLAKREKGMGYLEKAIESFLNALEELTRERVPLLWATTQNNLGIALMDLGEEEVGTERLDAAVEAFRTALKEYTHERFPLDWAMTKHNFGIALRRLGERENGTLQLEAAVEAFREALGVFTRARLPLQWAKTQKSLGAALMSLGMRENGTRQLEAAVSAFRAAIQEHSREHNPLEWATSYGSQGIALMLIAEREIDAAMAAQAVQQIEEAYDMCRASGDAYKSGIYETMLSKAQSVLEKLSDAG